MKDMSKVFFMLNGYTFKNIAEISWNKPTPKWEQDDEDIYGEHENVYAPSKKLVITLTLRNNTEDMTVINGFMKTNTEGAGSINDSRGQKNELIAFDKAVVMRNDKTYNRSENTTAYTINASVVGEVDK